MFKNTQVLLDYVKKTQSELTPSTPDGQQIIEWLQELLFLRQHVMYLLNNYAKEAQDLRNAVDFFYVMQENTKQLEVKGMDKNAQLDRYKPEKNVHLDPVYDDYEASVVTDNFDRDHAEELDKGATS